MPCVEALLKRGYLPDDWIRSTIEPLVVLSARYAGTLQGSYDEAKAFVAVLTVGACCHSCLGMCLTFGRVVLGA